MHLKDILKSERRLGATLRHYQVEKSELYPLDPQIFYVLFQILYIRFTPYTFSLFNLIMA